MLGNLALESYRKIQAVVSHDVGILRRMVKAMKGDHPMEDEVDDCRRHCKTSACPNYQMAFGRWRVLRQVAANQVWLAIKGDLPKETDEWEDKMGSALEAAPMAIGVRRAMGDWRPPLDRSSKLECNSGQGSSETLVDDFAGVYVGARSPRWD